MKKHLIWTAVFAAVILICAAICLLPRGRSGETADIYVDGKLYKSVRLCENASFRIETDWGYNDICVENGAISVTEADCRDGICINEGAHCESGAPIVCLPHRLVIRINSDNNTDTFSK